MFHHTDKVLRELNHHYSVTMRGKRLSDDVVKAIYTHHDTGKSQRQIARELCISLCAVQGALSRRFGHTLQQKDINLGRRRCTSPSTDAAIRLYIKRHRFDSNSLIASAFNVSRDTIRRRSMESNLRSRLALRDYLRKHHKTARRNWCIANRRTDFTKWIFSDESNFVLSDCSAPGRLYVHRNQGEKYSTTCVLPAPTSDRRHLMVWGCIASNGQCAMTFVDGNVNSDKYISILRTTLFPLLENLPLSMWKDIVFQQDNARPHTARTTMNFLHTHHIRVPFWPALSPDINPIENVWAIMKRKVRLMQPTSIDSLKTAIQLAWRQTVTPALCCKLYSSLPTRMHNIIRRHGLR